MYCRPFRGAWAQDVKTPSDLGVGKGSLLVLSGEAWVNASVLGMWGFFPFSWNLILLRNSLRPGCCGRGEGKHVLAALQRAQRRRLAQETDSLLLLLLLFICSPPPFLLPVSSETRFPHSSFPLLVQLTLNSTYLSWDRTFIVLACPLGLAEFIHCGNKNIPVRSVGTSLRVWFLVSDYGSWAAAFSLLTSQTEIISRSWVTGF